MPMRPEVMTNLFDSSLIFNAINPATAVAAPFTWNNVNSVTIPWSVQKVRVANVLLMLWTVAAGVTCTFNFEESSDLVTWSDVPNTTVVLDTAAPNHRSLHLARIETQWMTGSFVSPKLVLSGAGSIAVVDGTWILHDLEVYPDLFEHLFGLEVPLFAGDLNQKTMY